MMIPLRTITVALTFAAIAIPSLVIAAPAQATGASDTVLARADEISAQQRYSERRPARRYQAPVYNEAPQYYRGGGADPSIAPNGRPYPVPEYLRGQCYIDDGYGRFSACSNR